MRVLRPLSFREEPICIPQAPAFALLPPTIACKAVSVTAECSSILALSHPRAESRGRMDSCGSLASLWVCLVSGLSAVFVGFFSSELILA